ncbi:MAG: hypothetical protein GY869_19470, partial [Planctomycetes bacterium]|nr:hypothetical protein [Planctomycetota bacterium]
PDSGFVRISEGEIVTIGSLSLGGSWGDFDNNGYLDLFVANGNDQDNLLFRNNGDGSFTTMTDSISYPMIDDGATSGGSCWGDYDNDGDLDLFVANRNGQNNLLYANNNDGSFTKISDEIIVNSNEFSVSASWADYDRDGDLDLFVANGGHNALYENTGSNNHWFNIKCVGTLSNTAAIGAKVRVKATIYGQPVWQLREISAQTGYAGQNSLRAHFGLGNAALIDSLKIEWPSGLVDIYTELHLERFVTAIEGDNELITEENQAAASTGHQLFQNYPNPFNPASFRSDVYHLHQTGPGTYQTTTILYKLSQPGPAVLKIYNITGQAIKTLINDHKTTGLHSVSWDGKNKHGQSVAPGIYFYRLRVDSAGQVGFEQTKRMVLIK